MSNTDPRLRTRSGKPISELGLGCSRFGSILNPADEAALVETIHHALTCGVNLFDTADIYGQGDSERILGKALKDHSDDAFIITKVGKTFSWRMRILRPLKGLLKPLIARRGKAAVTAKRNREVGEDFNANRLPSALRASLRRLGLAQVDALLLHSAPASVVANAEVADALRQLKVSGKIRYFGVSCDDISALSAALEMLDLQILQLPVDMIVQMRPDVLDSIRRRGITVIAREAIVLRPDLSPAAAVSYAKKLPGVTSVLAGTSSPERIAQLATALELSGRSNSSNG